MGLLDFISPGQKNRQASQNSTQMYLQIAEIRDDSLVLKNGGVRAVLRSSSINFNLKSDEEQNAIIYSYQGFLNSLEFPIQIVVRSKKLDIDNYIDQIKKLGEKQVNPLLQEQTYEYAEYVKKLVEYADIMEKDFLVIVPYDPVRSQSVSKFQSFFQRMAPKDSYSDLKLRHHEFENLKKGLTQRVNVVKSGLENCGLKIDQLTTTELIEEFYQIYNPITSRSAKLRDIASTSVETDEEKLATEKREA